MNNMIRVLFLVLIIIGFYGCGSLIYQPTESSKARLGEVTPLANEFQNLPEAKEPIVVAVYQFRDMTGQYKPTENGTSWSTAVTQGSTNILVKALEDSKWFVPIERENISDLLNERKIIRSSRQQYGDNTELPALLFAGIILEGGIVSYDANIITGGAGARYFGAGASRQYRQDRVTVYLRAISVSNGKVLKTVYTSKTILSQAVNAQIFRYVLYKRLLEIETGYTYNEPSEMAVTEAIQKAVQALIIEGGIDGLWAFKDKEEIDGEAVKKYLEEKENLPNIDILGREITDRRKVFDIDFGSSSLLYKGDYAQPKFKTGIEFGLSINHTPSYSTVFNMGFSKLSTEKYFSANVSYLEVNGRYRFLPYSTFTPFAFGGIGLITGDDASRYQLNGRYFGKINGGLGFEYLLSNAFGLRFTGDFNYILSDKLDYVSQGKYNDFYWRGNIGINYYFGRTLSKKKNISTISTPTGPRQNGLRNGNF